jgi:hypothetical protein
MTRNGLAQVIETAETVQRTAPELFQPIADHFGVNIQERLGNPRYREGLCYESY